MVRKGEGEAVKDSAPVSRIPPRKVQYILKRGEEPAAGEDAEKTFSKERQKVGEKSTLYVYVQGERFELR